MKKRKSENEIQKGSNEWEDEEASYFVCLSGSLVCCRRRRR